MQASGSDRRFLDPSPARSPGPVSAQCHVGSTQAPLASKFLPLAALLSDRNPLLHHRCRHLLIRRREHKRTHSLAQSCIWTFLPAKLTSTEQQLKHIDPSPPPTDFDPIHKVPLPVLCEDSPAHVIGTYILSTLFFFLFSKVLCLVTTY